MGFRLNLKGICRIELPLSKHGVLGAFHRFMIYDDFCQISIFYLTVEIVQTSFLEPKVFYTYQFVLVQSRLYTEISLEFS